MIPKLHISKGSFKLDKIDNISTNTKTNDYCIKQNKKQNTICFKCYSFKGLEFRKNMIPLLQNNSDLLSKNKKDLLVKKYFLDRKLISKAQGLKLMGNKLFYVPENDRIHHRTEERFWGLLSFDINNLVESKSLRKIINYDAKK